MEKIKKSETIADKVSAVQAEKSNSGVENVNSENHDLQVAESCNLSDNAMATIISSDVGQMLWDSVNLSDNAMAKSMPKGGGRAICDNAMAATAGDGGQIQWDNISLSVNTIDTPSDKTSEKTSDKTSDTIKEAFKKKVDWKDVFNLKNLLLLVIAGIINATGVMLFLVPAGVIDGGFSGTSVFLSQITNVHVSIYLVCINLPFFIFGFKKLGWKLIVASLVAIFSYSAMSFIFQSVLKWDVAVFDLIKKDVLLAALFGGIISGMGSGLTIRFGGAIDGIEVMAVVFAKKIGITVGQFVMSYNIIIYAIASIWLKDLSVGLYSVISYAIGLKVVDFIVDGFDKGKAFTIITNKGDAVAKAISDEFKRGVTMLDGKGYYSKSNKTMLYCVVNRFEIVKLKKLVESVDPFAFVAINDISEVVGNKTKFAMTKKLKAQDEANEQDGNGEKKTRLKYLNLKFKKKVLTPHESNKNCECNHDGNDANADNIDGNENN